MTDEDAEPDAEEREVKMPTCRCAPIPHLPGSERWCALRQPRPGAGDLTRVTGA